MPVRRAGTLPSPRKVGCVSNRDKAKLSEPEYSTTTRFERAHARQDALIHGIHADTALICYYYCCFFAFVSFFSTARFTIELRLAGALWDPGLPDKLFAIRAGSPVTTMTRTIMPM